MSPQRGLSIKAERGTASMAVKRTNRLSALLALILVASLLAVQPGHADGIGSAAGAAAAGEAGLQSLAGATGDARAAPATAAASAAGKDTAAGTGAPGVGAAPAPSWRNAQAPGEPNPFTFRCERPSGGLPYQLFGVDLVVYGCPIRVYDGPNWHFGSPALAVNPRDSREAAFFSLHGDPDPDGSTDQSRRTATHTTFTTADRGISWGDEPIHGGPTGASLGDYASGTMDADGNLYMAYGWHDPVGPDQWDGSIGLFKAATTRDTGSVLRSYENPHYILAREIGNQIRSPHIVYVEDPGSDAAQQFADANETQAPSEENDFGEEAVDINRTDHIVVAWHEKAIDWQNSSTGLSGWIDFSWRTTDARQEWGRLDTRQVVGPCFDASNPVVWQGSVYIGCVVDKGYKERTRARIGDVDIWKFDPETNRTSFVGFTGLNGPNPRLAAAPDGAMAALTVKVEAEQQVDVRASFGWFGRQWSAGVANLGPSLHGWAGGLDILSAHVTGIALTEDQHTLYVIYKEWNDVEGGSSLPDPTQLDGDPPRLHDYRKVLVAMNACEILQAAAMELGQGIDAASYSAYMSHPAMFNDIQDGMQYVREPNGEELVYFAINDYGAMQFGAIVEGAVGEPCANFPIALPSIPPPPVPQALATGLPANYGVGALVGAASLAMVGYLLAARRRAPSLVTAEDR